MANIEQEILELFDVSSASPGTTYVSSLTCDRRYSVVGEDEFHIDLIRPFARRPSIPLDKDDWLHKDTVLGPYEKSLLDQIFSSRQALLAYRGGSGCGKSSIVKAVANRCSQVCTGRWSEATGLKTFFSVVDFQTERKYSISNDDIVATPDRETQDQFFQNFQQKLLHHILNELVVDKNDVEHFKEFFLSSRSKSAYLTRFLGRAIETLVDVEQSSELRCREVFQNILMDFSPEDSVTILILFLAHLAEFINEIRDEKEHLVIVFDNTDRLHTEFLTLLLDNLRSLASEGALSNGSLKLAVFMRLSTSRDTIAALGHPKYLPISSPSPESIVIPRMMGALLGNSLHERQRGRTVTGNVEYRFVEFLIRYFDPYDRIDELLLSVAGTNLRAYFTQLSKLLASRDFHPRIVNESQLNAAKKAIETYLVDIQYFRLLDKFCGIIYEGLSSTESGVIRGVKIAADEIAELIHSVSIEALNSPLISEPGFEVGPEALSAYIDASTDDPMKFRNKNFDYRLEAIIYEIYDLIHQQDWNGRSKPKRVEIFLKQLTKSLDKYSASPPEYRERTTKLSRSLLSVLRRYTTRRGVEQLKEWRLRSLFSREPSRGQQGGDISYKFPRRVQNRYKVSQIVLSNTVFDASNDYRPVNIFTADGQNYSPISLEILSVMSFRSIMRSMGHIPEQYSMQKLRNITQINGYSDAQFETAMLQLFRQDNRLLYSTVADLRKATSMGLDSYKVGNSIYLSWAGWRYSRYLAYNTSYLQWTLLRVPGLLDSLGIDVNAMTGLGSSDADPQMHEEEPTPIEPSTLFSSLDLLRRLVGRVANERLAKRLVFFPGEFEGGKQIREIYFEKSLPEIDIFIRLLVSVIGTIDFQIDVIGRGTGSPVKFEELRSKYLHDAGNLVESSQKLVDCDFSHWKRRISLSNSEM